MVALYESGYEAAKPNFISYVNLVTAYVRHSSPSAAQKAEDILFEVYGKFKAGNNAFKPTVQTVATVIDCWQKSGRRDAGEKAEALLDWVLELYRETRDEDFKPNEIIFAITIGAWGRSRMIGKATRAWQLLTRFKELNESGELDSYPNTHCYTAVINGAAFCINAPIEKKKSLRIAVTAYKDLRQTRDRNGGFNELTYSSMLKALRNLMPEGSERSSAVQTVFKHAISDGLADEFVVHLAASLVSAEELRLLFPTRDITKRGQILFDQLPVEWSINCDPHLRP